MFNGPLGQFGPPAAAPSGALGFTVKPVPYSRIGTKEDKNTLKIYMQEHKQKYDSKLYIIWSCTLNDFYI